MKIHALARSLQLPIDRTQDMFALVYGQCKRRTIFQFYLLRRRIHIISSSSLCVKSQSTNKIHIFLRLIKKTIHIRLISVNKTIISVFFCDFPIIFWNKVFVSGYINTMQLRTTNYEWNTLDLLGQGTYGHVYKVSLFLCFFTTQNRTFRQIYKKRVIVAASL